MPYVPQTLPSPAGMPQRPMAQLGAAAPMSAPPTARTPTSMPPMLPQGGGQDPRRLSYMERALRQRAPQMASAFAAPGPLQGVPMTPGPRVAPPPMQSGGTMPTRGY